MARIIWKGAISFGLVHVPVALYPASREDDIDFDWLDKRSMDPVGYKRVNKRTGKEIAKDDIVRGIKQGDGEYVLLSDEEIRTAYPQTTQTIAIEAFVTAVEIPFLFLEKPFYLEPLGKSGKVYALLREAMVAAGAIGIARVVMHTKEHLAALIPTGPALLLNTLRWPAEIRPWTELNFPPEGKSAAGLKEAELKMAGQLIKDMQTAWRADDYADQFKQAIVDLVEHKVEAGKTAKVRPLEEDAGIAVGGSNVVDLSELLKRSLATKGGTKGEAHGGARKSSSAERAPARRKKA